MCLVDVDQARASAAADEFGIPGRYTDVQAMLAGEAPDIVVVCTPPVAHGDAVSASLDSGAWVWCEKPPALSLAEYDEIAAHEGEENGPYVGYVFQHRFGSGAERLRQHVDDGTLGRPLVGVCHTLWYRDPAYFEVPWRARWDTEGGGPTMGHGIHQMDLVLSLLGDWSEVTAVMSTTARETETEDVSMAVVAMESGATLSVVNSLLSPRETSYLRFDFERASVELEHLYGYDNSHWRWTPAPGVEDAAVAAWQPSADEPSSHGAQLASFLDSRSRGERPRASGDDGRRVLELIAGMYASALTGTTVRRRDLRPGHDFYHSMYGGARHAAASVLNRRRRSQVSDNLSLHKDDDELTVSFGGVPLARYVLRPQAPQVEAPKPYFHPLNTVSGAPLTAVRPWDHRWHKGLQMTWSHICDQNFWGGPTYVRDSGEYEWLDNVGSIRHQSLDEVTQLPGEVSFTERLTWVSSRGHDWLGEVRTHRVHSVDAERGLWALDFTTALTNVRGERLTLGSPTTHGRPAAGYAGLFWRGPRSWTGCEVLTSAGSRGGAEAMGTEADWIALVGQHDEIDGGGTILGFAGTTSGAAPIKWFVRSEPFPVLCPSPSFDQTLVLEPARTLELSHRLVFVDRMCDAAEIRELGRGFAL